MWGGAGQGNPSPLSKGLGERQNPATVQEKSIQAEGEASARQHRQVARAEGRRELLEGVEAEEENYDMGLLDKNCARTPGQ